MELTLSIDSPTFKMANNEVEEYKNIIEKTVTDFFNQLNIPENIFIEEINLQLETVSNKDDFKYKLLHQLEHWQKGQPSISNLKIKKPPAQKNKFNSPFVKDVTVKELLHFLQTGFFSWELLDINKAEILKNNSTIILLQHFFQNENPEKIILLFAGNSNVFLRLLHYFPELCKIIFKNIVICHGTKNEFTDKVADEFIKHFFQDQTPVHPEVWQQFFFKIHHIIFSLESEISLQLFLVLLTQTKNLNNSTAVEQLKTFNIKTVERYQKIVNTFLQKSNQPLDIPEHLTFEILQNIFLKSTDEVLNSDIKPVDIADGEYKRSNPILFRNCGIILVHPFLQVIFTELNLLSEKTFPTFADQVKAVQILLYLSTSSDQFDEKEIHFLKLIVGLNADVFICWETPLTQDEKKCCQDVLEVLIKEWSVLKNTSVSTLQSQFLQRQGLVENNEKSIEIRWQKNALDILLNQFPFNYSIVKLPWLNKFLVMLDAL